MPRSNSSFGVADGGAVVSAALARRTARRAAAAPPGSRGLVLPRSSGSPGPRPPGAPTGGLVRRSATGRRRARAARRAHSDSGWDRRHRRGGARPGRGAGRLLEIGAVLRSAAARSRLLRLPGWAADSPAGPAGSRLRRRWPDAADWAAPRRRWAGRPEAGRRAPGGAPPSCLRRSSSWRLRYCSSSFWPVSCRSWFSSRWIRISGSASSDCAKAVRRQRQQRGERRGAGHVKKSG